MAVGKPLPAVDMGCMLAEVVVPGEAEQPVEEVGSVAEVVAAAANAGSRSHNSHTTLTAPVLVEEGPVGQPEALSAIAGCTLLLQAAAEQH